MLVYVNPNISGNVFIREGPSRASPSVHIPAYNYHEFGVLYEVDDQRDNTGVKWYHLRGLGWSMAEYFRVYGDRPDDEAKTWLLGLTREEIEDCIAYLRTTIPDGVD